MALDLSVERYWEGIQVGMVGTGHPTWRKPACKRHSSSGNSLAVQGLGLCVSTAGAWVPSLVREQRYCMPRSEAKKRHNSSVWDDDKKIWKWTMVMVTQYCECTWCHWIVCFFNGKKILCMSYHNLKRHRWGFLGGPVVKNLAATAGDTASISEPGRSHIL